MPVAYLLAWNYAECDRGGRPRDDVTYREEYTIVSFVNWILLSILAIVATAFVSMRVASAFDRAIDSAAPRKRGQDPSKVTADGALRRRSRHVE
jgi:hypothetical protein